MVRRVSLRLKFWTKLVKDPSPFLIFLFVLIGEQVDDSMTGRTIDGR